MLRDEQTIPRKPREGRRKFRDAYNREKPMHPIVDGLWLGSAKHAAWDPDRLEANG